VFQLFVSMSSREKRGREGLVKWKGTEIDYMSHFVKGTPSDASTSGSLDVGESG
jgi:hypothetical protein